ncbi:hypothetical protein [Ichthyenterobacterium magnum]|uniref:Uncharacterized protein n=1 Tax=Ichthyenterobacterium magnum TaxID=1230530 RepID=A0A420DFJ9_9FLAO|nr:hypothetical protein [Ichthyenterobacterium magnum]RKE92000.1 hypothetical protein BXY80_2432 [Ichthyenterobacterium magnum]
MKQFIKVTLFIVALSSIVIYSKTISNEIIKSYNQCVSYMANNTVNSSTVLGI